MTILLGDSGLASVGALKTFNTTIATPRETLLGSGSEITLPTVDPSANQVSFTIQSSDLPTITPKPHSMKYTAVLYVAGKNPTGGSINLTYSLYKTPNGGSSASVTTNQPHNTIPTNQFWTHSHYRFYDIQVGDTIEARVWSNTSGVLLDYYALAVYPTRMELSKAQTAIDLAVSVPSTSVTVGTGTLTEGTPSVQSGSPFFLNPIPAFLTNNLFINAGSSVVVPFLGGWTQSTATFSGRPSSGDSSLSSTLVTHATNRPFYLKLCAPTISFRELRL